MGPFPYLAIFTVTVSGAVLHTRVDDLRGAPLAWGAPPVQARPLRFAEADEGLLDHELASADPIDAWLDRYLTPPAH
jgi:hypothetical protein